MFLLLKWTVMYIIIITSTETTNLENFPLTASPVSKLLIRKKLNFRWPQNRKLFSSRFINAVHLAHAQMMMNCFCGMVDRRKRFSLISSRDHCQISSPSRISHTPRAGFEPAQNLSSGLVEWSCAVVITTTPRRHYDLQCILYLVYYILLVAPSTDGQTFIE